MKANENSASALPFRDPDLGMEERVSDLIDRLETSEKLSLLLHENPAIERLDIPPYDWWNECCHGVARAGKATVFPQAIGLAATFDTELMGRVALAISYEARAKYKAAIAIGNHRRYHGLTFWTPNINIFRDPRWGRGQETYGEDPFLTASMGVAFVKNLQGDDPEHLRAAACAKHFAVHSGPEKDRHTFNAQVSQKDLWETYLPAFQALVESGVEAVMGAYNRLNDEPCCGSPTLLQEILRDRWAFKGHVVSDCWALIDFHKHHKVTNNEIESAALAITNGLDLNCGCTYNALLLALGQNLITESDIDRSLRRLLNTRVKLGHFDTEGSGPYDDIPLDCVGSPEHRAIARVAATKSIVLLKNEGGILPISRDWKRIGLFGPNAANIDVMLGNYYGLSSNITTFAEGLTARAPEGVGIEYMPGALLCREKPNPHEWACDVAGWVDGVIAVLGLHPFLEGEEGDALESTEVGDRTDVMLPESQIVWLRKLVQNIDNLILVLTGGSAMALPEDLLEQIPAVLYTWYPGEAGGEALAEVLFGDTSPSGRLPITVPKCIEDLPPFEDYSMVGRTYRYLEKEPLFPFGFGLSYTQFHYEKLGIQGSAIAGQGLTVTVTLRNIGQAASNEIVQIYIGTPDLPEPKPQFSLVAFQAVHFEADASETFDLKIDAAQMTFVDETGKRHPITGTIDLWAGSACPHPRSVNLGAPKPMHIRIPITGE